MAPRIITSAEIADIPVSRMGARAERAGGHLPDRLRELPSDQSRYLDITSIDDRSDVVGARRACSACPVRRSDLGGAAHPHRAHPGGPGENGDVQAGVTTDQQSSVSERAQGVALRHVPITRSSSRTEW